MSINIKNDIICNNCCESMGDGDDCWCGECYTDMIARNDDLADQLITANDEIETLNNTIIALKAELCDARVNQHENLIR